jgi:uncharacterized protein YwgA
MYIIYLTYMDLKFQDFMCLLYKNNMINIHDLLKDDEDGLLNRLKLQKYVYLAQTSLKNNFGYEYNIYNNGPYSPELANFYYDKIDFKKISSDVVTGNWDCKNEITDKFLSLFKDKDPNWLEVATTLIDSTNYCENEHESLDKVYAIKSKYSSDFIDNTWNELKEKNLVHYETGLKLNSLFSVF